MVRRKKYLLPLLLCLTLCGCLSNRSNQDTSFSHSTPPPVEEMIFGNTAVNRERLASKGIIEASSEAPIYCRLQSQVVKLAVHEGERVVKDQVLLVLDDEDIQSEIVRNHCAFEQAKFQLDEILIGQGYKKADFHTVPENIMSLAKVKSGFNIAEQDYKMICHQLTKTVIKAPVSGVVTHVKIKLYEYPVIGTPVLKIIDGDKLKVVFSILESEINKIKMGNTVEVSTIAYPSGRHKAVVTRISPTVDENGMIKIEASLEDTQNLMPGMTAIVNI